MESNIKETKRDEEIMKSLELVAQGETIIQTRIRSEVERVRAEFSGSSSIIAAVFGVLCVNALTYMKVLPLFGNYEYFWATIIGFILGASSISPRRAH